MAIIHVGMLKIDTFIFLYDIQYVILNSTFQFFIVFIVFIIFYCTTTIIIIITTTLLYYYFTLLILLLLLLPLLLIVLLYTVLNGIVSHFAFHQLQLIILYHIVLHNTSIILICTCHSLNIFNFVFCKTYI